MNEQEAIEILKDGIENLDIPFLNPVYEVAIKALEKQIPKKPIRSEGFMVVHHCPICNDILPISKPYCGNCGQAISWEDKE